MSRKGKQIAAWVAIILLVLLYVVTLLVAIFDTSESGHWFMGCALATLIIPILTWIYIWMYGKLTGKETMADLHLLEDPKDKDAAADETKNQKMEKDKSGADK